jgi:hypothetical protein
MSEREVAEGVRLRRVSTPQELEAGFGSLPAGVRYGVACELTERRQALRLDGHDQCVYHFRWDGDDIAILIWGPMSSLFEAAILLSSIKTLAEPLDEEKAVQLYRRATYQDAEVRAEPRRQPVETLPAAWSMEFLGSALRAAQRLFHDPLARRRTAIPASQS